VQLSGVDFPSLWLGVEQALLIASACWFDPSMALMAELLSRLKAQREPA
jgi:hypothetical protein